ncbi:MAG: helix-turn-helix domain-containing protein [Persicimonas sp.]
MASDETYIQNIRREVGANVRRFRYEREWSQSQLAKSAGLNRSYLSMVENGRRNISLDNLVSLALALQVEPSELLVKVDPTSVGAE